MKTRRTPMRKCIACQEMKAKKELIRVVRTPTGETQIDLTGKKSGRGAYLCGRVECFRLAKKSRAFDRALKAPVSPDIYDQLEEDFLQVEEAFHRSKEGLPDEG